MAATPRPLRVLESEVELIKKDNKQAPSDLKKENKQLKRSVIDDDGIEYDDDLDNLLNDLLGSHELSVEYDDEEEEEDFLYTTEEPPAPELENSQLSNSISTIEPPNDPKQVEEDHKTNIHQKETETKEPDKIEQTDEKPKRKNTASKRKKKEKTKEKEKDNEKQSNGQKKKRRRTNSKMDSSKDEKGTRKKRKNITASTVNKKEGIRISKRSKAKRTKTKSVPKVLRPLKVLDPSDTEHSATGNETSSEQNLEGAKLDLRDSLLADLTNGVIRKQPSSWDLSPGGLKNSLEKDLADKKISDKIKTPSEPIEHETESSFEDFSVSGFSSIASQVVDGAEAEAEADLLNFKDPTDDGSEIIDPSEDENNGPVHPFESKSEEETPIPIPKSLVNPLKYNTPRDRSKTLTLIRGDSKGVQFEQENRWFFRVTSNIPPPRPYRNVPKKYLSSSGTFIDFEAKYTECAKDLNDFSLETSHYCAGRSTGNNKLIDDDDE